MKRMLLTVTTTASLFAATAAQARLGWTLEQCKAQYGYPAEDEQLQTHRVHRVTFLKEGIEIQALDGKVYKILYKRLNSPWTQDEALQLLRKNVDQSWRKAKDSSSMDSEEWLIGNEDTPSYDARFRQMDGDESRFAYIEISDWGNIWNEVAEAISKGWNEKRKEYDKKRQAEIDGL
jgi:hypothetical protein